MKKIFTSLIAAMLILLAASPAAFASDMKLYRNDNDHYRILIPSDFEYQDVNKINTSDLRDFSLLAVSPIKDKMISVQKLQVVLYKPTKNWSISEREKLIRGVKENEISKNIIFEESGELNIHNNNFFWVKFEDSTKEFLLYFFVQNNVLYSLGYIYPLNDREKIQPKITESINSLKFDDIQPNWYWVNSTERATTYIDTNSITSYKNSTTKTICKMITARVTSPSFSNEGFSNLKAIFEFKEENGVTYYRPLSMATYDDNDNFIKYFFNLINMNNDPSYDRWWKNVATNKDMEKIADLLFEKDQ